MRSGSSHPTSSRPGSESATSVAFWLLLAALGYSSFAIYGSLVPLKFQPHPLSDAVLAFRQLPYLELGIASRADWVANILLFVPLTFLWLGALWPRRSGAMRVLAALAVLATATALSAGIEFVQYFFPPRTQSINDIAAECMGATLGVLAWLVFGARLNRWLAGFQGASGQVGLAERVLYLYLFVLFGYGVLPLDLTISPAELFHKWREGRVVLLPFSGGAGTFAQRTYDLASDIAIWLPAAFLWRISGRGDTTRVVLRTLAWAALLEVLQLFVYSRVSDFTDIVTAGIGGVLGAAAGSRLARPDQRGPTRELAGMGTVVAILGVLAWSAVILAVFWYPFDFRNDWGFVHERIDALKRAPFTAYYYGTEFRAVTEVLHKTGFFFPLGALLAPITHSLGGRWPALRPACHMLAILIIGGMAGLVEAGQIFLPLKNADLTDAALEFGGGLGGYAGLIVTLTKLRRHPR